MSEGISERLADFFRLLLERRGAIVDWPAGAPEGLAMLPAETAAALRCLEILPLSASPSGPLPVNLASDFLDRVDPLVAAEPRVAALRIPWLYLKQADMAEPVARAFTWLNARVRLCESAPERTEYHTWYFQATLDSADRWEEVIPVTVNARSGSEVATPDPLQAGPVEAEPLAAADAPATARQAARAVCTKVEARGAAFVARLDSRRQRDARRLQDYYQALLREDRRRAQRRRAPEDPDRRKAKVQAVQLELRRKLLELDERYALRVTLTPLALIRLDCPVLAIHCDVARKSARRPLTLFWNALAKALEPVACSRCGAAGFSVAFTDDQVLPLCPPCHGA